MKTYWVIASRGSKLALWQARFVQEQISEIFPDFEIKIKIIKTLGDTQRSQKLWEMGGKGVFTKELEEALLSKEADFAVHSLKDLPTQLPLGLCLGAVPVRESPQDVLVSKDHVRFEYLPQGARVGTSSFRRRSQLLSTRPDLVVEEIRGNVSTRIKKVYEGPLDAVVLAKAGMIRLGLEEWITQEFAFEEMLPAVGQGALAVEIRKDDREAQELLNPLQDEDLFCATGAERAFLDCLGGGCRLPIAAYGEVAGDELSLEGLVATPDGKKIIRKKIFGNKSDFEKLGKQLAQSMLEEGASKMIHRSRDSSFF
ncbi:MAG: hydroxymethylbilane synthase [Chlamydiae bacterium]|nr:hydroxymethylbilane synthase [Chlamydiota bacterium]MBI3277400.1 hydroxymethylbilane synthase [Chlamydiota bacterium]